MLTIALFLLVGDAASTFIYHVPEHALGRLHCRVHHESKQNFQHYAVLSSRPLVMLDGFLSAVPDLVCAITLYPFSQIGTILGLLLGGFHVIWRHTTKIGWLMPTIYSIGYVRGTSLFFLLFVCLNAYYISGWTIVLPSQAGYIITPYPGQGFKHVSLAHLYIACAFFQEGIQITLNIVKLTQYS
ncbi:hypothetical protein [cf. Phormidesmis sp. LEGE 11477]|uniref:hypothetical protein n=1 Tax=cf. Phormidesmis sp. LEGE 11477 TaxID=1828680 RepID=UPI001880737D|nr:hypothetical protein [cf. Phormidesmis sp. LEGE 11477]MBE9060592.1 hypothetical protein [cf. Phormidesmis sp. LEGE 11477]